MPNLVFNSQVLSESDLIKIKKNVRCSIKNIDKLTLEFNTLALTDYVALYTHVLRIFICSRVHKTLCVSTFQLLDFIIDISKQYKTETYYHTFHHAVDVVTMLYYFIYHFDAYQYLSESDVASLMIAALCHDIGHPGLNNAYQVKSQTELATKYGEKSTLETYSVELTLSLLKKHQFIRYRMEDTISNLILSTDMENHIELEQQAYHLASHIDRHHSALSKTRSTRQTLSQLLLHAADISNVARPWKIAKLWSDRISLEFFSQGDQEKRQNLTVSPGMDRETVSQASNNTRFGQFVLPFFQLLACLLPRSHVLVDFIIQNSIQWEKEESDDTCRRMKLQNINYASTALSQSST